MTKLITLGCSVTDGVPNSFGLKEKLSELLNLTNLNLAHPGGGSNQLQISMLIELLVNNKIDSDDVIYWQITNAGRDFIKLKMNFKDKVKKIQKKYFTYKNHHHYTISKFKNIFDGEERINILSNSPLLTSIEHIFDHEDEIQKLLATIILFKKFCNKIIIIFGWKGVMGPYQEETFKKILDIHDIEYIKEYYVDYSKNLGKIMPDGFHPTPEAGSLFAEEVVFTKIKNLNWF
jgi:hypothetical protein